LFAAMCPTTARKALRARPCAPIQVAGALRGRPARDSAAFRSAAVGTVASGRPGTVAATASPKKLAGKRRWVKKKAKSRLEAGAPSAGRAGAARAPNRSDETDVRAGFRPLAEPSEI